MSSRTANFMNAPLPQSPSGPLGRVFGWVMERLNAQAYRRALEALQPVDTRHYLEIGFGTGRFLELLVEAVPGCRVAGLDPTATMVAVARDRKRLRAARDRVDLREGNDAPIPWRDETFDGVVAIHCFQFWAEPDHSVREIHRALRPNGRFVLVFRHHGSRAPQWLPNALSRSGREVEQACDLLQAQGFSVTESHGAGTSRVVVAVKSQMP